jgi:complex iron-sulfur molybdoenzyme family reductase subunit gamma
MIKTVLEDRRTLTVAALALGLILTAGVVPALVDARPAREIPAPSVEADLSGPHADGWSEVPAADVPMSAAASGLPGADSASVGTVDVQAARSDEQLHIRLQWHDADPSRATDGPRAFADGAAVQLPVDTSAQPAIAMGSASNLVNVWYWRADQGNEELLAGGPGSTTVMSDSAVSTTASHDDDTWTVVYSRALSAGGANRTVVTGDRDLDVAFAVWNGSEMERSGHKAASQWYYFPLGPEESGAPFQTVLWTVAGVAAVVVVLVTIQGVRRTRGGAGGEES